MFQAIRNSDLVALLQAIDNGEDLEQLNEDEMTPLLYACFKGNEEFVNILLDKGANADVTVDGETALSFAVSKKNISLPTIERLASNNNINFVRKDGTTPLMMACMHGRVDVVKFLLQKNVNVNAIDNERFTAMTCLELYHGPNEKRLAIAQLLIDAGTDLSDPKLFNFMIGDDEMTSLLFENNVFIPDDLDLTYVSEITKRKINANLTKVDVTTSDLQFLTQKKKEQLKVLLGYLPNELLFEVAKYL